MITCLPSIDIVESFSNKKMYFVVPVSLLLCSTVVCRDFYFYEAGMHIFAMQVSTQRHIEI